MLQPVQALGYWWENRRTAPPFPPGTRDLSLLRKVHNSRFRATSLLPVRNTYNHFCDIYVYQAGRAYFESSLGIFLKDEEFVKHSIVPGSYSSCLIIHIVV